jgi:hypothetical protein
METENTQTNIPEQPVTTPAEQPVESQPVAETEVNPESFDIEIREKKEEKIEYGDDIDPEDARTIGNIVEKQTASVKKALQESQDRLEVDTFIQTKPEFAKYKGAILKYLQHPVYSQIPVKNIATLVAGNDLVKLGAEMERQAQSKAASTQSTGQQVRTQQATGSDWKKMTKNDFESHKRKIMGHQV